MANNWDFLKKKADKSIQRSRSLEACFEKEEKNQKKINKEKVQSTAKL